MRPFPRSLDTALTAKLNDKKPRKAILKRELPAVPPQPLHASSDSTQVAHQCCECMPSGREKCHCGQCLMLVKMKTAGEGPEGGGQTAALGHFSPRLASLANGLQHGTCNLEPEFLIHLFNRCLTRHLERTCRWVWSGPCLKDPTVQQGSERHSGKTTQRHVMNAPGDGGGEEETLNLARDDPEAV